MARKLQFKLMKVPSIRSSILIWLLLISALWPAAKAQQMNYQGRLTDASGNVLQDGQYTLTFNMYDATTGGSNVWGPFIFDGAPGDGHGAKADLVNGRFNIILGPNDTTARPISGAFGGARYLQITVAQNPPLLPRQQILAAPEALHAVNADHATIADGISGSLNITGNFNVGSNSTVVGTGTFGALTTGNLTATGTSTLAGLTSTENITAQKSINFPSSAGQKLNLYGASYAVGMQDFTEYFRTAFNFAWFLGGSHVNAVYDPGAGGKKLMTLDAVNGLSIFGQAAGTGQNTLSIQNTTIGPNVSFVHWGPTGDWYIRSAKNVGNVIIQDQGGFVGIGGAPSYPLHVRSSKSASLNVQVGDLRNYSGGVFQHNTDPNTPYSIVADQFVLAPAFQATSDRRIKTDFKPSNTRKDLETIRSLQLTDYHFIDRVSHGDDLQKGFIAQEVKSVIPEAVSSSANYIPDIFSHASAVSYDHARKTLAVTLLKAHQLKAGDNVRIAADNSELDLTVESVPSDREFVVGKCDREPSKVFVYGRKVPDFLSVNYDRIFSTGIGAIQELAQKIETLEKNQSRLAELEQKAKQVDRLEHELSELKELVAKLSSGSNQKLLTASSSQ
jgi:hypothetical protein